jgi:hypothetical protein
MGVSMKTNLMNKKMGANLTLFLSKELGSCVLSAACYHFYTIDNLVDFCI